MKYELTNQQVMKRVERARRLFVAESNIVNKYLGERIVGCDVKEQRLDLEFDMSDEFANANGAIHGGLIAWIADMSIAVAVSCFYGEYHGSTINLDVNYINPIGLHDKVISKAYCQRLGKSVRRGRCDLYVNDVLMVTAMANYTGKAMTGERMVAHIDEETWRIEDGMVRGFILNGSERAAVIDSGLNRKDFKRAATRLTDNPNFVINTHADHDHTNGNDKFDTIYMNEKDWPQYKANGGAGTPLPVNEGDIIDLGGRPLKIIETPGHTKGSICILDINNRALYAGDTVQNAPIFMFGEYRNLKDYIESIGKLISLSGEFDVIYCSHGDYMLTLDFLPKLYEAAKALYEGKDGPGYETEVFGHHVRKHEFGVCSFLMQG